MFVCNLQTVVDSRQGIPEAILHQHLDTVLYVWNKNRELHHDELIDDFSKGIEDSIAMNNYSVHDMDKFLNHLEFRESVIQGIYRALVKERFVVNETHLYIGDTRGGLTLQLSNNEKLKIVKSLTKMMCHKNKDIVLSPKVDAFVQLLCCLGAI